MIGYRGTGGNKTGKNNGATYYSNSTIEAAGYGPNLETIDIDTAGFDIYDENEIMDLLDNYDGDNDRIDFYRNYEGTIGAEMLAIDIARENGTPGIILNINAGEFDPNCSKYIIVL
jgi:hypothetical protein